MFYYYGGLTCSISSMSTLNQVLGFETGTIDFIPNYVGSTLTTTTAITSDLLFTLTTADTLRYKFNGTEYLITMTAGSYTAARIATALNTYFTNRNTPIIVTFNSSKFVFTKTSTINSVFAILGTSNIAVILGFARAIQDYSSTSVYLYAASTKIVDLSGNNSFYVGTNLGVANYSFLKCINERWC